MNKQYNDKKTILILTHVNFDNSPYCKFVHEHAKALKKEGYKVIVFAAYNWFPILSNFQKNRVNYWKNITKNGKEILIDGVNIIYKKNISFSNLFYNSPVNLNGISYFLNIKKIFKKLYKENNIVLIDAHTFKVEGYVAKKLRKKYDIFTTLTLHGTSFDRNFKSKNGRKEIINVFKIVDKAVCVSNKIKRNLLDLGVKNSVVIYNGINNFSKITNKVDEKKEFSIISVGNLVKLKNFDITIRTIKKLKEKYPNIYLTIIGDGPEKENLKQLVKELDIEANVNFTGYLSNSEAISIMKKNEIFLLPSSPEGFGIAYVEAMNNGCITIGTKGEGIDGFIIDGENGFLVNPNIEDCSKLIDNIYSNKFNLERIKERAYIDSGKLTWEKNAREYINFIK